MPYKLPPSKLPLDNNKPLAMPKPAPKPPQKFKKLGRKPKEVS